MRERRTTSIHSLRTNISRSGKNRTHPASFGDSLANLGTFAPINDSLARFRTQDKYSGSKNENVIISLELIRIKQWLLRCESCELSRVFPHSLSTRSHHIISMVGREGFEPPKPKVSDLQSDCFNHLHIYL